MFQSICFVSTSNTTKKETNKSNNTTNKSNTKNDKEYKNIKNENVVNNKKWWLSDDLFLNLLITTLN